jgi:RimJ/RimL family protein N-acetyltransferase
LASLAPPDPPLADSAVLLRPWRRSDVDQLFAACQDELIQRYIPVPRPYRRSDAEAYVERTIRQWADGSKAAFAMVPPESPDSLWGAINVAIAGAVGNSGYWVIPDARGRGIAGHALRLITDWAFGSLDLGVILLEIRPENERSRAVARSAGYHESGRVDINVDTGKRGALLYSRLASDEVPAP